MPARQYAGTGSCKDCGHKFKVDEDRIIYKDFGHLVKDEEYRDVPETIAKCTKCAGASGSGMTSTGRVVSFPSKYKSGYAT